MDNLSIRSASLVDANSIANIHVQAWKESYRDILTKDFLDNLSVEKRLQWRKKTLATEDGATKTLIAIKNERIIGFCDIGKNRDTTINYPGEMYALYLLNAYKKIGIGQQLFNMAINNLHEQHMMPCVAWVLKENSPARRFYEKNRGQAIKEKTIKIGDKSYQELAYLFHDN